MCLRYPKMFYANTLARYLRKEETISMYFSVLRTQKIREPSLCTPYFVFVPFFRNVKYTSGDETQNLARIDEFFSLIFSAEFDSSLTQK